MLTVETTKPQTIKLKAMKNQNHKMIPQNRKKLKTTKNQDRKKIK